MLTPFVDQSQLLAYAEGFLRDRIDALERDVAHCLRESPYAPFPALLYCFATIDLLGALFAGKASRKSTAKTTEQAADYMRTLMHYNQDQVDALQQLFRHKLVHLATPKAVVEIDGKLTGWAYFHDDTRFHMKIYRLPEQREVLIRGPNWKIPYDHEFDISIRHFVEDIKNSVYGSGGYLESLRRRADLQQAFQAAVMDIYDPQR